MPPPAPTAPAAPAAAPSTPAAPTAPATPPPAPVAPPTAPPAPGPAGGDENPYEELDAAIKKLDTPPETTKGKDQQKPKPPAPRPGPDPKELRAELDRVKGDLKAKTDAQAALEARIADYESKGKDTEALTKRLEQLEKDIEQTRAENRMLKQETSPEFKAKYDAPFDRMANRAKQVIEKIVYEDPETGQQRQATWDQFARIYQHDDFTALRELKTIFGEDGAQVAMGYYRQLKELDATRQEALTAEKAQWKQRQEAEQANEVRFREERNKFYWQVNKDISEKVPDYHDSPDDKELSEARTKAYALYDAPAKTPQGQVIKDAHNRQRVAAYSVQKVQIARLKKELADAKAELEGYKETPPNPGTRTGGTPPPAGEGEDFETGLRKHVTS